MSDQLICTDKTEASNIVIFGATGDLTKRKLMPALLKMIECGLVHPQSRILGVVNKRTEEEWIQMIKSALDKYSPGGALDATKWQTFSAMLHMVPGDLSDDATYSNIAKALQSFDGKKNALFYCASPPQWYPRVTQGLHAAGLIDQGEGYRRIVIEKPFGMDLKSAQELNRALQSVLQESQIYRIDHYLGKESVQNLCDDDALVAQAFSHGHGAAVGFLSVRLLQDDQRALADPLQGSGLG